MVHLLFGRNCAEPTALHFDPSVFELPYFRAYSTI